MHYHRKVQAARARATYKPTHAIVRGFEVSPKGVKDHTSTVNWWLACLMQSFSLSLTDFPCIRPLCLLLLPAPFSLSRSLALSCQVVKDRVNLAASLSAQPLAGHASSSFGAEFALHQSTVSTAFHPSQGKVSTVVASKLSQGISLSVSADAIFGQQDPQSGALSDAFKFGYGLSLG